MADRSLTPSSRIAIKDEYTSIPTPDEVIDGLRKGSVTPYTRKISNNYLEIAIYFKEETPVMDVSYPTKENIERVEEFSSTEDGTTFDLKVSSFSQVGCCTQCLTTCTDECFICICICICN